MLYTPVLRNQAYCECRQYKEFYADIFLPYVSMPCWCSLNFLFLCNEFCCSAVCGWCKVNGENSIPRLILKDFLDLFTLLGSSGVFEVGKGEYCVMVPCPFDFK